MGSQHSLSDGLCPPRPIWVHCSSSFIGQLFALTKLMELVVVLSSHSLEVGATHCSLRECLADLVTRWCPMLGHPREQTSGIKPVASPGKLEGPFPQLVGASQRWHAFARSDNFDNSRTLCNFLLQRAVFFLQAFQMDSGRQPWHRLRPEGSFVQASRPQSESDYQRGSTCACSTVRHSVCIPVRCVTFPIISCHREQEVCVGCCFPDS
mmetsp:Transcript_165545/g.526432  ORF Transcript_165545/g.526432 Transcript_165545/m.526432 type:complete len:209 (-) Transcript_165545:108-734(-)